MKKKIIIGLSVALIAIIGVWYLFLRKPSEIDISVKPQKGTFRITVTTSGELQAKNSIDIQGPANARAVGIWQMKINRLVPEGSIVKEGDFVAELDKSEIMTKVKEVELNVQKFESQYLQTKLDSTLNLSNARDESDNLKFSMEEQKLLKEQSAYEAPSVVRQAEMDYEKTQRSYEQSVKNYVTKVQQAIAKLTEVGADLSKEQAKMTDLMQTMNDFIVKAPAAGMVIYAREWNGKPRTVGSTVSPWDPTVARLPDLTSLESITYINEVDIQKIKVGQTVEIGLDAVQNKKLKGKVVSVANIGEQRPNTDSKVFEVHIEVIDKDTTLRPSMTTSNEILVETLANALYVPLEAVHADNGKSYIFKKSGSKLVKQEVKLGKLNENEVVIEQGLTEKDEILLSMPKESDKLAYSKL